MTSVKYHPSPLTETIKTMKPRQTKLFRIIAVFLLITLICDIVAPMTAYALTSGPVQPEFASFEPVGTTSMVNEFTGSFTYNLPVMEVPGANGGGYAVSLSYHSGTSPEEDASWVGYGWTLNPGAIIRNKRGFADDHDGAEVTYWNKARRNETVTVGLDGGLETFSVSSNDAIGGLKLNAALRYNNYKGYGYTAGVGVNVKGLVSLGYSAANDRDGIYDFSVNPMALLNDPSISILGEPKRQTLPSLGNNPASRTVYTNQTKISFNTKNIFSQICAHGINALSGSERATNIPKYYGFSTNVRLAAQFNPEGLPIGVAVGSYGNYTWQENQASDLLKTYGYMYSRHAAAEDVMDYYVEKDYPYSKRDKFLGLPFSNADMYVLTGEGLSGGFRLINKKPGHFRPNSKYSRINIGNIGFEGMFGKDIGLGASTNVGYQSMQAGEWKNEKGDNDQYQFASDGDEPYFFRFTNDPGGSVEFADHDAPTRANIFTNGPEIPGFKSYRSSVTTEVYPTINKGRRSGRSSYIAHTTIDEMQQKQGDVYYRSNNKNTKTRQQGGISFSEQRISLLPQEISDKADDIAELEEEIEDFIAEYPNYQSDPAQWTAYQTVRSQLQPLQREKARLEAELRNRRSGVGELAVHNENGNRYVYGLPVYSRKEAYLSFGLEGLSSSAIEKNYLAYKACSDPNNEKIVSGEQRETPYATTYLLTEITTPDYIDRTNDGPTTDDFGGYTKFNYRRVAGNNDKYDDLAGTKKEWYKWRIPYRGLQYDKNSLSDRYDDRGTVSYGEKELYYLESIETKTHIAYFITNKTVITTATFTVQGSGKVRLDGFEANHDEAAAASQFNSNAPGYAQDYSSICSQVINNSIPGYSGPVDGLKNSMSVVQDNKLEVLERIILYKKDDAGEPINNALKTVNLEYDYMLMSNTISNETAWTGDPYWHQTKIYADAIGSLNSAIAVRTDVTNASYIVTESYTDQNGNFIERTFPHYRLGKLTLKKVWFEYEGVVSARIAPYEFGYEYTRNIESGYDILPDYVKNKYQDILHYADDLDSYEQNPPYHALDIDRWGSYQYQGRTRYQHLIEWVNQTPNYEVFDPAAWQLKRIKLPSGGEIHVQYEQNEYSYVQDKPAMTMVNLLKDANHDSRDYGVTISTDGISLDNSNNKYYVDVKSIGIDETNEAEVRNLKNKIAHAFIDNDEKIYFKYLYALTGNTATTANCVSDYISGYAKVKSTGLDVIPGGKYGLWITLGGDDVYSYPRQAALDFVQANRNGILHPDCLYYDVLPSNDAEENVLSLLNDIGTFSFADNDHCREINYGASYLRLPMTKPKKGGGIRVKRVLMFDKGIVSGEGMLYGSEYIYETGVATSEPQEGREDNTLVKAINRREDRSDFQKIIAGRDRSQFEGPLAESLYPMASIGYSKVIVRNIHSGKSSPGYSVSEFHTCKDYPLKVEYTDIEPRTDWLPLTGGIYGSKLGADYGRAVYNMWATQGFSVVDHAMHGQPKKIAQYGGAYTTGKVEKPFLSQEYEYFDTGEKVPVMSDIEKSITYAYPGKEMEVVFESREMIDYSMDFKAEGDASLGLTGVTPAAFVSGFVGWMENEAELRTHVTTKVIRYPALVKQVRTVKEGLVHVTKNVAFNPDNGKPILTETNDGYDRLSLEQSPGHNGKYHNYIIPASQQYREMGQKAFNERRILKPTVPLEVIANGASHKEIAIEKYHDGSQHQLWLYSSSPITLCNTSSKLFVGDLIEVKDGNNNSKGIYNIGSIEEPEQLHFSPDPVLFSQLITLLPVSYSTAVSTTPVENVVVEVIRSGRTNELNAAAGGITTYGEDKEGQLKYIRDNVSPRQQFADLLNSVLVRGGGAVHNSTIPSGLEFNSTLSGMTLNCDALQYHMVMKVSNNNIKILFSNCTVVSAIPSPPSGKKEQVASNCQVYAQWDIPRFGEDEQFVIDDAGRLALDYGGECLFYPTGFSFCPETLTNYAAFDNSLPHVIAASAQTFDDNWPYSTAEYGSSSAGSNVYEQGNKGRWRPLSSYVYRVGVEPATGSDQGRTPRAYNKSGVFEEFHLFRWDNPANSHANWLKLSTVTNYSPNGEILEEQDILGIRSAAKFGHKHTVPVLVAKNATSASVVFESYEDKVPVGSGSGVVHGIAHAGKQSYRVEAGGSVAFNYAITQYAVNAPVNIRFWAKNSNNVICQVQLGSHQIASATKIAQTGEWSLYEAVITTIQQSELGTTSTLTITPQLSGGGVVWIDDVRVQPQNSEMVCYVYDALTLRLIATFDSQHFGLYYQYDGEGKLVRKLIETERGIKTVQESQYNIPRSVEGKVAGAQVATITNFVSVPLGGSGEGGGKDLYYNDSKDNHFNTPSNKVDLLDIHLSPDERKIKVLGDEGIQIPNADKLSKPDGTLIPNKPDSLLQEKSRISLPRQQINLPANPDSLSASQRKKIQVIPSGTIPQKDSMKVKDIHIDSGK